MKIDCTSDLHGSLPFLVKGDLLIVAGDLTASDELWGYKRVEEWLKCLHGYKHIVIIAGNHDGKIQKGYRLKLPENAHYLQDSGIEIEGFKIWGSPWTPSFYNWHFMKERGDEIKEKWDLIPDDTDILVTHGPAKGMLDYGFGCEELRNTIDERLKRLKLHVCGHIHESYGYQKDGECFFVNASMMNAKYRPYNKPIMVYL